MIKQDPWLAQTNSDVISTSLSVDFDNVRVQALMIPGSIQWDRGLIDDIFNPRDKELIFNIPLSCRQIENKWYWNQEISEKITIKFGYRAQHGNLENDNFPWKRLWSLPVPPKVRVFMRRTLKELFPWLINCDLTWFQILLFVQCVLHIGSPPILFGSAVP